MKRFLNAHPTFVEDLYAAVAICDKAGRPALAGAFEQYVGELRKYKPEPLYVMDKRMRTGLYGLKMWQKNTLQIATQYEACTFTRQEIEDLAERLDRYASTQRNYPGKQIRIPDFDTDERYGIPISLGIGNDCALFFTKIKGDYSF